MEVEWIIYFGLPVNLRCCKQTNQARWSQVLACVWYLVISVWFYLFERPRCRVWA